MKKIAIITAGFAPKQSEITETISLILSLSELGVEFKIFAANMDIPLNHHTLHPLESLNSGEFDGLVFPGGLGVATVLSNWHEAQEKMTVNSYVEKNILAFFEQSKPISAICLAPILLARVLKNKNANITFGQSEFHSDIMKKWKVIVDQCPSTDFITDRENKLITTPAYMNDDVTPFEVYTGIRLLAKELVEMA